MNVSSDIDKQCSPYGINNSKLLRNVTLAVAGQRICTNEVFNFEYSISVLNRFGQI